MRITPDTKLKQGQKNFQKDIDKKLEENVLNC